MALWKSVVLKDIQEQKKVLLCSNFIHLNMKVGRSQKTRSTFILLKRDIGSKYFPENNKRICRLLKSVFNSIFHEPAEELVYVQ